MDVPPSLERIAVDDGVSLPFADHGSTAGPCVVLVHGMGDSWRSYKPVIQYLPDDVRVLAQPYEGTATPTGPTTATPPPDSCRILWRCSTASVSTEQ